MFKFLKKYKLQAIAIFLSLFIFTFFCTSSASLIVASANSTSNKTLVLNNFFSKSTLSKETINSLSDSQLDKIYSYLLGKNNFTRSNTNDDYSSESLAAHFTNSEYSEADIDILTYEYTEQYRQYLSFNDEGYLIFDISEIEIASDIEYAAIETITENVHVMNKLVEKEVGHINEEFEFVIDEEKIENDPTYNYDAIWGFELSWNKVSACFHQDSALILSVVLLFCRLTLHTLFFSIEDIFEELSEQAVVTQTINEAIEEGCEDIIEAELYQLLGFFNGEIIIDILNIIQLNVELFKVTTIFGTVFSLILSLLLPSTLDCIIVLYNSMVNSCGAKLIGCWFPTFDDRLGVSLEVLE